MDEDSYGFRKGRNCGQAINRIKDLIDGKRMKVLDADIRKCFNEINHEELLKTMETTPKIRWQVRQ